MKPDERSFRIALVADRYVNPPPGGLDALAVLAAAGCRSGRRAPPS